MQLYMQPVSYYVLILIPPRTIYTQSIIQSFTSFTWHNYVTFSLPDQSRTDRDNNWEIDKSEYKNTKQENFVQIDTQSTTHVMATISVMFSSKYVRLLRP